MSDSASNQRLILECRGASFAVADGEGEEKFLLRDISLVLPPGQCTAIIGPSGAGKSTLLNLLSGRTDASSGQVMAGGFDLAKEFSAIKKQIAVAPQHVALHDSLTIEQELAFSHRLRSADNPSPKATREAVDRALQTVDLAGNGAAAINTLSGGQQKRVSLANEIICDPQFVFLDEVTSGLDENGDREIMRLCASLAQSGKTVVAVTHNVANLVAFCDNLIVLSEGGRVAFVGPPKEALKYFRVQSLSEIYDRLQTGTAAQWSQKFLGSESGQRYYESHAKLLRDRSAQCTPTLIEDPQGFAAHVCRQLVVLCQRYSTQKLKNLRELAGYGFQCALIGGLLALVFGEVDASSADSDLPTVSNLMFLLSLSAFWFGCNNSSKEIVKERWITLREVAAGLSPISYLLSKAALLSMISIGQVAIMLLIVRSCSLLPGSLHSIFAALAMTTVVGVHFGLLLSSLAKSEETAMAAVPCLLIPQVILADVIAHISGLTAFLSKLSIATLWSYAACVSSLPEKYERLSADRASVLQALLMLSCGAVMLFIATASVLFVRNGKRSQLRNDLQLLGDSGRSWAAKRIDQARCRWDELKRWAEKQKAPSPSQDVAPPP